MAIFLAGILYNPSEKKATLLPTHYMVPKAEVNQKMAVSEKGLRWVYHKAMHHFTLDILRYILAWAV